MVSTIQQINSSIMFGEFNNDQLNSIVAALKYARAQLSKKTKSSLMVGDNVNFTSSKTGKNVTGVVTKIAIKYVTVRSVTGLWKVPASMLALIEE